MSIIALVFDYDDTIVPDSTTQLLRRYGIDTNYFWKFEFKNLVSLGYDPIFAVLKLILDKIDKDKPLGELTNEKLKEIGEEISSSQYPGFDSLISDLKELCSTQRDISIEFYVISGGLEEIIRGNRLISDNFSGIYGCRLAGDDNSSELKYIKRAITFTEKTRYLFEINKGISQTDSDKDPSAVNRKIKEEERTIPFKNMIYIGDGLTDIPCFSLVDKNGGISFAVLHHDKDSDAKIRIFEDILLTKRAISTNSPQYSEDDDLGHLIRHTVANICSKIMLDRSKA